MTRRASRVVATIFVVAVGVGLMPRDSQGNCGGATPGQQQPQPRTDCSCFKDTCRSAGYSCDDNNKCTTHDVCDGKGSCVGTPTICPAGPCATAACNATTGQCASTNKPNGTRCGPGTCKNGTCDLAPVVR